MKAEKVKFGLLKPGMLMLIFCMIFCSVSIGYAGGKKGEWKLPSHYPDGFDGYGCLMAIYETRVVIDDSSKHVSPEMTYNTPSGKDQPIEYMIKNSLVGYMLNEENQIISIWLVRETCKEKE